MIHVLSHVVSYGSSLFEGVRCYALPTGPAVFRLGEHMQRLINSSKIYRMEVPFSRAELERASIELIQANKFKHCYLRPIVLRGYNELGVDPRRCPIDTQSATSASPPTVPRFA